jgi:major membrane immunogen (membrane-anchored lipoprotein)
MELDMSAKTKKNLWVVGAVTAIIAALLVTGCGRTQGVPMTVPEGAKAGELVSMEPCTYKEGKVEYAADCGTLLYQKTGVTPNHG